MGKGTRPDNLIISWTVMPEIDHNGPRFKYTVSYMRDAPGETWHHVDIPNWRTDEWLVNDQPTYQKYRIKVGAANERGESRTLPAEVIGYSGEDGTVHDFHYYLGTVLGHSCVDFAVLVPQQAPTNFTLVKIESGTTALFSWNPVPIESVRGELRGYKIQTWNKEGSENMKEIILEGSNKTIAQVTKLIPFSTNHARVFVYNGQ